MTKSDADQVAVGVAISTDKLLDRFEDAWQSGEIPDIGQFLAEASDEPQESRQGRSVELVAIDLEYRWRFYADGRRLPESKTGEETRALPARVPERPHLEDYLAVFPQLGTLPEIETDLVLEEYRVRHLFGDRPNHDEFRKRFGRNRPELADKLADLDRELQVESSAQASESHSCHLPTEDTEILAPSTTGLTSRSGAREASECDDVPTSLGRYEIKRVLGQGAMGVVYEAHDTRLGRDVALKIPKIATEGHSDFLARFYREARSAATLTHRNICQVFDVGEIDGQHYISMAYIDGRPLADIQSSEAQLSDAETATLIRKVALALEHAHKRGVVHRDLKPSNIMIDAEGEPVVMDFGLARRTDVSQDAQLTQDGAIVGSPAYMSPEQVESRLDEIGPHTDVYSLGVVLYRLLTGQLPFSGSMAAMLGQIVTTEPQGPSEIRPNIDPCLAAICMKMLTKRIEERYASMAEVAQAIDDVSESPAVVPASQTTPSGTNGPSRTIIAMSFCALVLVACAVTFYLRSGRQTVKVEFDDSVRAEDVSIWIDKDELNIEGIGDAIKLKRGGHVLEIKRGDMVVKTRDFRVTQGDNDILRITLSDTETATAPKHETTAKSHPPRPTPPQTRAALNLSVGSAENVLPGLIPRPAKLPGIERWQIDTVAPRGTVYSVSYSPDGKLLACGSHDDNHVRIFDVQSGDLVRIFRMKPVEWGHGESVPAVVAWCPDGKRLLGGGHGQYGGLHIWDTSNGERLRLITDPGGSDFSPVWSPDGQYIAVGGGRQLIVLDSVSGVRQFEFAAPELPQSVAWSPDGKRLVGVCSDRMVRVWSIGEDAPILTLEGHQQRLWCVAWSPDGGKIASGGEDKRVIVWDAESGQQEELSLLAPGNVRAIAWSPDGQHIACACDRGIRIWKAANGNPGPSLEAPGDFSSLAWHPDGRQMATVGGHPAKIRLWDTRYGTLEREIGGPMCGCVAWSPDGSQIATGAGGSVRLWAGRNGLPGKILKGHESSIVSLAWKSDGSRLATAGDGEKKVQIWDPKTGTSQPVDGLGDHFGSLAWHPQGNDLIGAGHAGSIFRCRASGLVEKGFIKTSKGIRSLSWSPDGQWIATALDDHEAAARIWSVTDGKCGPSLLENTKLGWAVAFSPDGRHLAVGNGMEEPFVDVLELADGAVVSRKTWKPRLGAIHSIVWSPDGRWIAVGGRQATSVKLWDVHTGEDGPVFPGGGNPAGAFVAWSPDGNRIAVGSRDQTVRVWDIETQEPLWVAVILADDSAAVFTAAGELLHADPGAEHELVYLVEKSFGSVEMLSPSEFGDVMQSALSGAN